MAALPMEVRPFLRRVQARRRQGLGLPAWEFAAQRYSGLAAVTGMGPAAARRAARVLMPLRPRVLVCLGFGGALAPDLAPGELVLGESFWDFNPHNPGPAPIPAPRPPHPLSRLVRKLNQAGVPAVTGNLITTPFIIHKQEQGKLLMSLRRAVADLETGVWAGLAAAQELPFLALRAVTDTASEEIPDFIKGARGTLSEALGWLARRPDRLPALLHLWRRGHLAARRLAAALILLLPLLTGEE